MTKISQIRFPKNEFRMMCDATENKEIDVTAKNWTDNFISHLIAIAHSEELIEKWGVEWEEFIAKLNTMTRIEFQELVAEINFFRYMDDENYRAFFGTLTPMEKIFHIASVRNLDLDYILGIDNSTL